MIPSSANLNTSESITPKRAPTKIPTPLSVITRTCRCTDSRSASVLTSPPSRAAARSRRTFTATPASCTTSTGSKSADAKRTRPPSVSRTCETSAKKPVIPPTRKGITSRSTV